MKTITANNSRSKISKEEMIERIEEGMEYLQRFRKVNGSSNLTSYKYRDELVHQYAWSVLDAEALYNIWKFVGGDKVVSVGCGTGYNEHLMRRCGINVVATNADRIWDNKYADTEWLPDIDYIPGVQAVEKYRDANVLFLSWPSYDEQWAYDTLKAFTGDKVIYVGEGYLGCCADENFFDVFNDEEKWKTEYFSIPRWCGLHDAMKLGVRNRKGIGDNPVAALIGE